MSPHRLSTFYVFAAAFPTLSILICWVFFYSLNHFTSGRILPISETVLQSPESRIFAATMNFESLVLLFLYLIRNQIISLYHKRHPISTIGWTFRTFTCRFCTFLVPLGLSFVSSVTLNEFSTLHLLGTALFFWGSIIYYLVSDYSLTAIGFRPSILSRSISWVSFGCSFLYIAFFAIANFLRASWVGYANIGAIFQYFTALAIFVKVFLFYWDVPRHYFAVVPIGGSN
jgi:hypothetical protein